MGRGEKQTDKTDPPITSFKDLRVWQEGMELVKDRTTKEHAVAECAELMELCREKGVLIGKGGLMGNIVRIAPPMTIAKAQCDQILKAFDESLTIIEAKA